MSAYKWPKGKHQFGESKYLAWHDWVLVEHGWDGAGYLQLLWVCPCGAYNRQVITPPFGDGTPVSDPLWEASETVCAEAER